MSNDNPLRLISSPVILSYPYLLTPSRGPQGNQDPKFTAAFIFPPDDFAPEITGDFGTLKERVTPFHVAMITAARAKWGDKADAMIREGGLRLQLRKDAVSKGYPEGSVFFNARGDERPGLVARYPDPATNKPAAIPEGKIKETFYPGCWVRVLVTAYPYDNVSKGVSLGLNGIQWWADGKRLDNRIAAQDAFTADLSESPASLDDLAQPAPESADSIMDGLL